MPLIMGEGLFDLSTVNAIAKGCIPPCMVVEVRNKTTSECINFLKQASVVLL